MHSFSKDLETKNRFESQVDFKNQVTVEITIEQTIPSKYLPVKLNNRKTKNDVKYCKVKDKDTRTTSVTSFWCIYC